MLFYYFFSFTTIAILLFSKFGAKCSSVCEETYDAVQTEVAKLS